MSQPRYVMVMRTRRCVRCMACTVACRAENEVPDDASRNWITQSQERGRFPDLGMSFTPGQCNQCDNPHCVRVCPAGATSRDADGITRIDRKICIGCRYCIQACPYEARFPNRELGVADKCDFCSHRIRAGREPACVETCPARVRVFGDANDPTSEVSRLLAEHKTHRLKVEAGTDPKIYYIDG